MKRVLCVGHAVEDHVFRVPALPTEAVKHQAIGFAIVGGGPAANAAVAIARLGGAALLAARVGADSVGASIVKDLEADGVDCALVKAFPAGQSSVSAVMVDDAGRRMLVNYLDPSLPRDPGWLTAAFPANADVVLADTRWPEGAQAALTEARARRIPAILDADNPAPEDADVLACASHLAFSAEGLRRFTGEADLATGLRAAAARFGVWCCVTDGADGALIATDGDVSRVPAPRVEAVDTLAAGDVWHGAFALALAESGDERQAVAFACAAAALKCTRAGGRAGAPTREELTAFQATHDAPARAIGTHA